MKISDYQMTREYTEIVVLSTIRKMINISMDELLNQPSFLAQMENDDSAFIKTKCQLSLLESGKRVATQQIIEEYCHRLQQLVRISDLYDKVHKLSECKRISNIPSTEATHKRELLKFLFTYLQECYDMATNS